MGFEDIHQPESSQEKLKLRKNIQALISQSASVERVAELLGAEKFLTKSQGRGGSGTVLSFKVEDFIQWVVDSAKDQNYHIQLPDHMVSLEETILPPDAGEIRTGSGAGFEEAGYIPRTRYLIDLLTEMKLQYAVVDGTNTPEMMRKMSYKAFLLPQLGKLVLVCDEEGNATYLVNNVRGERNWQQFINRSKSELRSLVDQGEVAVVSYPGDSEVWKSQISTLLSEEAFEPLESDDESAQMENALSMETIPAGWISRQDLLVLLGRDYEWIVAREQIAKEQGREIARYYKIAGEKGRTKKYYSPEFINSLVVENRGLEVAPEGWLTLRGIALELDKDRKWVEKRVDVYRSTHPKWFQNYRNPISRQMKEYMSPQIVAVLREDAEKYKEAPAGWYNVRSMALELGTTDTTINRILPTLSFTSEGYSGTYLDRAGKPVIFYRPEVVSAIRKKIEEMELPDGFISLKSLERETGVDSNTIHRLAEKLIIPGRQEFRVIQVSPEFKKYGIHKDLADRIRSEFAKRVFAPAGWMNRIELARKLGRAPEWVDVRVAEYLRDHPEWKAMHKVRGTEKDNSKLVPYFNPELVAILELENEEFEANKSIVRGETRISLEEKDKKVELRGGGWKSIAALAREGEHSYAFVRGLIEEYFNLHPEVRESQEVKLGFQTFYNPEVSRYILAKLAEMKSAPAGWKSLDTLEGELGRDKVTIRKIAEAYLARYPDEGRNFIGRQKMTLHYGPNVVMALKEHFSAITKPPMGWLDRTALARALGKSPYWVENRQKSAKLVHPEWFKNYLNQHNRAIEYSSPDFLTELQKEAKNE